MDSVPARLHVYERAANMPRELRAAVSLHCHTYHSKEILSFIPHYAARIPLVAQFFKAEMDRYLTLHGKTIDFTQAFWTPPVSPRQVLEVETLQIETRLGLPALVSITDHDDIEAGVRLQVLDETHRIPISLEWTVPYRNGFFHLGVHNLPPENATDITQALLKYTAQEPDALPLRDLFALLNEASDVLLVLNHPLWDIEFIGAEAHAQCLGAFLAEYGGWLHALELNGFRSWQENQTVMRIAEDLGFPVVTGGDRHGCQANTMLNLTRASSFAEFAAEVRDDAHSEILLLPEYRESLTARTLEIVADVLRQYAHHSLGQPRWTDRIFIDLDEGAGARALSQYWPNGGPAWVRAALWVVRVLGSREFKPARRLALSKQNVRHHQAQETTQRARQEVISYEG